MKAITYLYITITYVCKRIYDAYTYIKLIFIQTEICDPNIFPAGLLNVIIYDS